MKKKGEGNDIEMARGTLRPFILITLIHADKRENVGKGEIVERVIQLFECRSVVVSKEGHRNGNEKGEHYHVGIWGNNASKNTLRRKIRETFKEWQGRSIDISLHKGWGSICKYILKEDKKPMVWGEYSLEQIKLIAEAHSQHKEANPRIDNDAILKRLEQIEEWWQVYRDDILRGKVLINWYRMKEVFEDLKVIKDIEVSVLERIIDYLEKKGEQKEYDVEELKEKYLVIDWIACQLCFKRPIKTKQLFIYGEPSTQKTLLLNLLSKVVRIYFASARKNDFAGANDYYDLWAFDEFHEYSEQNEYGSVGSTAEGTSFVNNLLKVLDGQECRLDSKYGRVFKKKRNVPIIMIANKLPKIMEKHGAFRARFYRIRFSTQIKKLEEERVIATLYGCIMRRIRASPYAYAMRTPEEVKLTYNKQEALILTIGQEDEKGFLREIERWREALARGGNPFFKGKQAESVDNIEQIQIMLLTSEGDVYKLEAKAIKGGREHPILIFEISKAQGREWQRWGELQEKLNLLDFASIPIKKRGLEQEKNWDFEKLFQRCRENENQKEKTGKLEGGSEEEPEDGIKTIKTLFDDKKEREWTKRSTWGPQVGTVKSDVVCSEIRVQRSRKEHVNDYAAWPLEIKIYSEGEGENGAMVFPLRIRNLEEVTEEQKRLDYEYARVRMLVKRVVNETSVEKLGGLKCEISIARNGEKQDWNLEA